MASLRIVILTQVQAEDLACEGKEEAALAICWELRLRPDLGLYRRATVNLLIAICIVNKTQAPKVCQRMPGSTTNSAGAGNGG